MQRLIITIGLPKSGKSTWAMSQGLPVVNRDSVRLALHGERFLPMAEPMVSILEENMVRSLFIAGHEAVIIDACHHTAGRRNRWGYFMETYFPDGKLIITISECDTDTCIKRAKEAGDEEIIPIIEKMSAEYELPDMSPPSSDLAAGEPDIGKPTLGVVPDA